MGFGGGSSDSTSTAQLPTWLENAAKENLNRSRVVSQIGYTPRYGVDVAGFTPMQQSAMQNTADAASAFGLQAPSNAMAGMPQTTTDAMGFTGYSSGNLYDQSVAELAQRRPGQYAAINSMFVDPLTGVAPLTFNPAGATVTQNSVSAPVYNSSTGTYEYTSGSNLPSGYLTDNTGLSLAGQDLALSMMNYPVWAPLGGLINLGSNWYLDSQMDEMAQQQGVYDDPNYGTGTAVMADANGNLNVVDLSTYTGTTANGDTVLYSGVEGGGVGNTYVTPEGTTWEDLGGYTGVTTDGSGNDWANFGGDTTTTTSTYDPVADSSTLTSYTPSGDSGNTYTSSGDSSWDDYGGYTGVTADGSGNDWDSFGGDVATSTSSSSDSGSSGGGGGTYCCTAMRKNGDWTSRTRLYRMHKWHFEQPQWWRDGYDVWGKVLANNLLKERGSVWSKIMNAFYDHHVKKGPITAKSVIADIMVYPAVFTIGMVAKVKGKHIEYVEVGE